MQHKRKKNSYPIESEPKNSSHSKLAEGLSSEKSISSSSLNKSDWFWMLAFSLLGLIPRILLLDKADFGIESDEAIVGLMARHIIDGEPWPIFYYGQYYMGSLEAILTSLVFSIFGESNTTLKIVPLVFSCFHIALVYLLAREVADKFAAKIAALLVAIGPCALILWGTKTRGGFIELVVLGTLGLLLSVKIVKEKSSKPLKYFFLGLVLGLGWWVNNQIVFYMSAIGFFVAIYSLKFFGFKKSLNLALMTLIGFFVGGFPFWFANLTSNPQFVSFTELFSGQSPNLSGPLSHFKGYILQALPIIFGARRFWSETDIFPMASTLAFSLYGLVLLTLLASWLLSNREKRRPVLLLFFFLFFVPLIFSLSKFGWLSRAPRYLLPLYSVIFVMVGVACSDIRKYLPKYGNPLAYSLFTGVLLLNLASNYSKGIVAPGQPFIHRGERVAADHTELYQWLESNDVKHVWTNYWIGYRLAFEMKEKITFSIFGRPRSVRIPRYEKAGIALDYPEYYVLSPKHVSSIEKQLIVFGHSYREIKLKDYIILKEFDSKRKLGGALELGPEQLVVPSRESWVQNMFDEDTSTRWGNSGPQRPGMKLDINFSTPKLVNGIGLEFGRFVHDAPRDLLIKGLNEKGEWVRLADFRGTKLYFDLKDQEFAEVPSVWKIPFREEKLKTIRLLQRGKTSVFNWSIAELDVYSPEVLTSRPN